MSRQYSIVLTARRACIAGIAVLALAPLSMTAYAAPATLQVWKDPNCGCCKDWIAHLEKNGFAATVIDQGNNAARARLGMPQKFGSCHTALIQGYVIEGHVPAADIQRLLKEKPKALGLSVPGMPVGSPGMDGPSLDDLLTKRWFPAMNQVCEWTGFSEQEIESLTERSAEYLIRGPLGA